MTTPSAVTTCSTSRSGYTGIKGLQLKLGALNLLDEDPPFTNQTSRFQGCAYDDRFHDPVGRTWTRGASYEF